ncbi:MAG: ABC transporter permease [Candidatus Bathyarchaeota archaeon]|jgi:tungstate transport system permease protein
MASLILEGLFKAASMIVSLDPALMEITLRSLTISGAATLLASCWSIPLGILVGLGSFRGRLLVRGAFNALLGVPTVTLGLLLWLLLSWSGPLGSLNLLYTPTAVILGQAVLITPIIVSFVANTLEAVDPEIRNLALTLGASEARANLTVIEESLGEVLLVVTASFNRAVAELGVALMVGGNIRGATRVLTTTIALETGRGDIALGIALAVVLMIIVGAVNLVIHLTRRGI